jgi:hypothetical protein
MDYRSICHVSFMRYRTTIVVITGLVPVIHVLLSFVGVKTWMAGTKPGHDDVEASIRINSALG